MDNQYSKNGRQYAQFDADNFSEAGLAGFSKMLKSAGAPVASITASNRLISKDGQSFKKADFYFENGQRASVRIRETGDLVALAVNGKAYPIKNGDSLASMAKELADYLKKGQADFDKSLAKKLKTITLDSAVRPATKTNQQRIDELKAARDEVAAQESQARAAYEASASALVQLQREAAQLQSDLNAEVAIGRTLKQNLKAVR